MNDHLQPTISVVVPCWNGEQFLASCLNSLLDQTLPKRDYEVILVDNNSSDNTLSIARQYPDIRIIQEKQRGAYAARNTGIKIARGEIIAFTDSDCVVDQNWLTSILRALSEDSVELVIGPRRFALDRGLLLIMSDYENAKVRSVFEWQDPRFYYGYTNNLAVQRRAFQRCGPFVEVLRGADAVFVSQLIRDFGPKSARFNPDMWVRHLEIETWRGWTQKMWIYGQSYQHYRILSHTVPLTLKHRLHILKRAVGSRAIHWRWPAFLIMASLNALAYSLGRAWARLRPSVRQPLPFDRTL